MVVVVKGSDGEEKTIQFNLEVVEEVEEIEGDDDTETGSEDEDETESETESEEEQFDSDCVAVEQDGATNSMN